MFVSPIFIEFILFDFFLKFNKLSHIRSLLDDVLSLLNELFEQFLTAISYVIDFLFHGRVTSKMKLYQIECSSFFDIDSTLSDLISQICLILLVKLQINFIHSLDLSFLNLVIKDIYEFLFFSNPKILTTFNFVQKGCFLLNYFIFVS